MLGVQASQYLLVPWDPDAFGEVLDQIPRPNGMGGPHLGFLATGRQLLQPELADRLEHPVARLFGDRTADLPEKALLDQRSDPVEHGDGPAGRRHAR